MASQLDVSQIAKLSYPEVMLSGQKTVGTSAVSLGASALLTTGVYVRAMSANTGVVYVGKDNTVTASTGYYLAAGDSVFVSINDLTKVFLIASAAAQGVCFLGS